MLFSNRIISCQSEWLCDNAKPNFANEDKNDKKSIISHYVTTKSLSGIDFSNVKFSFLVKVCKILFGFLLITATDDSSESGMPDPKNKKAKLGHEQFPKNKILKNIGIKENFFK